MKLLQERQQPPPPPHLAAPPPQAPAGDPLTAAILQRMVAAQEAATLVQQEANRLQQAVQAAKRAETSVVTFPKLKLFAEVDKWYQKLLLVISQPKYSVLYDPIAGEVITDGANHPAENSALYTEIVNNCGPDVEAYILAKDHLRNDGLAVMSTIQNTHNSRWSSIETKEKKMGIHQDGENRNLRIILHLLSTVPQRPSHQRSPLQRIRTKSNLYHGPFGPLYYNSRTP